MLTDKEFNDRVGGILSYYTDNHSIKDEAYIAYIDNRRFMNGSKKVWATRSALLASFRLPLRNTVSYHKAQKYKGGCCTRDDYKRYWDEFVNDLILSGRLKIIKLTPEK